MMDKVVKAVRRNVVGRTFRTVWEHMQEGDVGQMVELPSSERMSVQVFGNFDDALVMFHGSNEAQSEHFFFIKDELGDEFQLSEESGKNFNPFISWFRPVIVGGSPDTLLTVVILDRTV